MNKILIALLILFTTVSTQQPPEIEIIKEKAHKRLNFYAQNNSDTDQELFFMIRSEGFRRRADRPLVKVIPAGKRVFLMHLIPKRGRTDTTYTIVKHWEKKLGRADIRKTDSLGFDIKHGKQLDSLKRKKN